MRWKRRRQQQPSVSEQPPAISNSTKSSQSSVRQSSTPTAAMKNRRGSGNKGSDAGKPPLPGGDSVQQQRSIQPQRQQQQQMRRSMLHRKTPSLSSYQTTSITKHYELNHAILAAFESHYTNKVYRIAYAMGLQFVETALLEIPKHGYFYSARHERERMESSLEAVRVTQLLQQMQLEEFIDAAESDHQRINKLSELAIAQVEQASEDQYEGQRAKTEVELRGGGAGGETAADCCTSDYVLCEPILVAYDSFANVLCPSSPPATTATASGSPAAQDYSFAQQQQQQQHRISPRSAAPTASSAFPQNNNIDVLASPVPFIGRVHTSPAWGPEQWEAPSAGAPYRMRRSQTLLLSPSPLQTQRPTYSSSYVSDASSLDAWTSSNTALLMPPPLMRSDQSQRSQSMESNTSGAEALTQTNLYFKESIMPEDTMLEKALYLSGLEVTPTVSVDFGEIGEYKYDDDDERVPPPLAELLSVPSPPQPPKVSVSASVLEFVTLSRCYHEDFDQMRNSGLICVSFANTYQGRLVGSTNGCTVIAPLLCIHHLLEDPNQIPDPSLPDDVIEQVVDVETPAILMELRTKLGLSAQAFLIPSDSHDYLIDNGQLCQEQFVNVTGGNILNEGHLNAFVNALEDKKHNEQARKVAATFFFHEHVVAILKVRRDNGETCWYDLIDALPLKQTLAKIGETDGSFSSRIGLTESQEFLSEAFLPKTARMRCLNAQALTACLRWYACSKFSEDNISYIDQYPWDDKSCDFDPRVFQGFVWGSMSE